MEPLVQIASLQINARFSLRLKKYNAARTGFASDLAVRGC